MDTTEIPESFLHLAVAAEKFGVPDYVDKTDKFPRDELLRFWRDFQPYVDEINDWLSRKPNVRDWTATEVAFLYALQALDYAKPATGDDFELQRKNFENIIYPNQVRRVEMIAEESFREKRFREVVALLKPFRDDLSKVGRAKYDLALKRSRTNK